MDTTIDKHIHTNNPLTFEEATEVEENNTPSISLPSLLLQDTANVNNTINVAFKDLHIGMSHKEYHAVALDNIFLKSQGNKNSLNCRSLNKQPCIIATVNTVCNIKHTTIHIADCRTNLEDTYRTMLRKENDKPSIASLFITDDPDTAKQTYYFYLEYNAPSHKIVT